ncbi:LysR family transcriptional regulator [Indiicoccus explosivorum]|uniref:LysR family transcriptional regulator n=1 Tax=Indiicoccus explosivorum TaxID=1917864 RepID=UPI000B4516D6|nr:LysR family transcriptional regulator [Indiicoccus explosivorum]
MDQKLEIFVTIAEQKNFTRAGELLHMTPSAVSLSLKSLEKKMGVKLFDRTNKYVQLTEAGQILYTHAKEILIKYEHMYYVVKETDPSLHTPLSIGAAYTFGEYFLPSIIYAFNKKHPGIIPDITIQNSEIIAKKIHRQELDIGFIVEGEVSDLDVNINLFSQDQMVIVAEPNHPLIKNKAVDLEILEAETWIIRESGSGTREVTEKLFSQLGIAPKKIMSFGSSQTIKESVALGLGISYLSRFVVKKDIQSGTLGSVNLKDYTNKSSFYYVTHKSDFHSKAAALFLEFLKTYSLSENMSFHTKKDAEKWKTVAKRENPSGDFLS